MTYVDEIRESFDAVALASRDIKASAALLSRQEVRYLVDFYYQIQNYRIAANNQIRSLGREGEPIGCIDMVGRNMERTEQSIKNALEVYTSSEDTGMGAWAKEVVGIGPVISAGLLAHIDIERAPTAGHIWRYAGLEPTVQWLARDKTVAAVASVVAGGTTVLNAEELVRVGEIFGRSLESMQRAFPERVIADEGIERAALIRYLMKRPWNADLKRLCWIMGESFVKVQAHKDDVYGKLYAERKARETERNEKGLFEDQARAALEAKRYGDDTTAKACYEAGRLPPARIHLRATRYAVKIFLSHYQAESYRRHYGKEPPKPFAIDILGHGHYIAPGKHAEWKRSNG